MRVVVTGANGFLGTHLVTALSAAGHQPVAAVRGSSRCETLEEASCPIVRVDYGRPDSLAAAFRQADAVIHAAGGGKVTHEAEMDAINVAPTAAVYAAALDAKVSRVVLVSSLAAVGPSRRGHPHTDAATPAPVSRYGRSKRRAEALAASYQDRLWTVIVRPPALFGPRDTRLLPLLKMARRGVVLNVGPERMAICSGRDAARGIVAALQSDKIESGRALFVAHPESTDFLDLSARFARAWNQSRAPRGVRVPRPVLEALACGAGAFARVARRPSPFNRDKLKDAAPYMECQADGLQRDTPWRATPLDDDIAQTAAWFLAHEAQSPPAR